MIFYTNDTWQVFALKSISLFEMRLIQYYEYFFFKVICFFKVAYTIFFLYIFWVLGSQGLYSDPVLNLCENIFCLHGLDWM